VARVDLGLNMASAAILGSVNWHTSNISVIDHALSGGPNNLLFCLTLLRHNYYQASLKPLEIIYQGKVRLFVMCICHCDYKPTVNLFVA